MGYTIYLIESLLFIYAGNNHSSTRPAYLPPSPRIIYLLPPRLVSVSHFPIPPPPATPLLSIPHIPIAHRSSPPHPHLLPAPIFFHSLLKTATAPKPTAPSQTPSSYSDRPRKTTIWLLFRARFRGPRVLRGLHPR